MGWYTSAKSEPKVDISSDSHEESRIKASFAEKLNMSWYRQAKTEPKKPLVKTAQGRFTFDRDKSRFQDEWGFDLGDYQRWVVDTFRIESFMTKLNDRNVISLHVYNWHVGTMRYQEFWKFGADEEEECKKVYKQVIETCKEVIDELTGPKNEDQPKTIVVSKLRAKVWEIARDRLPRTNIPHINYYYDKAKPEEDWRSSIYGNRYPDKPTTGF